MRAFLIVAAALAALPALAQERPSEEAIFGAPVEAPAGKEAPAQASDRPSEDAMFGEGGAQAEKPSAQPAAVKPAQPSNRPSEDAMFGDGGAPADKPSAQPAAMKPPPSTTELAEEEREKAPDDPLRIGGQFYWRAYSLASERIPPSGWTFSAPTLLDAYFDARPNERIRGFALGRVIYDPTVNDTSSPQTTLMAGSQKQLNVVLDQLWLRFDLGRSVFITAGRQHVKWGVGRFWNPTDYLHQVYRDPLTQFDARVGTTMVKLHVPWERKGWNFYGIGLLEDTMPGGSLGKIGAGARAEVVLGPAEFGIDALVQRGHHPRFGADFSAGLGPVDVYGEVALRKGAGTLQDHFVNSVDSIDPSRLDEATTLKGVANLVCEGTVVEGDTVQATGGATYAFNFTDEFVLTAGAEYFFNSAGTTRTDDYFCMGAKGHFTPFYVGKHYLGLSASWTNPSRRTAPVVVLTNLSNLSDLSHLARLDYSMMLLTHLRVEAYTAYHYGHRKGELRFGIDYPSVALPPSEANPNGSSTPAIFTPYQAVELGLGLRISL